jgi:hypothetical protein
MNKKYFIVGGVVVIAIIAFVFLRPARGGIVDSSIHITAFEHAGKPTGTVLMSIPFLQTHERTNFNISFDVNADGDFSEEETLVTNFSLQPRQNWQSGVYVKTNVDLTSTPKARVSYNGTHQDVEVTYSTADTTTTFDLASVTNPEESMKGVKVARAEEPVEITTEDVPDINQQPGECAPTAAANSLTSLISKNGQTPPQANDMISELKNDMQWTRENGVLPDNFVAGKNAWAQRHNLPIKTEKIGDQHGKTTIDAIHQALAQGKAVELRMKFAGNAAATQAAGGHMVTVTGIHQGEGQTYLDINDPATPDSGTETVEIRGNTISNYGPFNGVVVLSWAFSQTWQTENAQNTNSKSMIKNGVDFSDGKSIEVIDYEGNYLPVSKLRIGEAHPPHATGPGCGNRHWHADKPVTAVNTGKVVSDPLPEGCGFGVLPEKPIMQYFPHELLGD